MRVLLIADSPDFDSDCIERYAPLMDQLIVTDGAAHKLPPSVNPDIICGDFDSIVLPEARRRFPESEFLELEDQNQNDLEKALMLAVSRGATAVILASAFGGRSDSSIANLSVMIRHHTLCDLSMLHAGMITKVLSDRSPSVNSFSFNARAGSPISCISLDGDSIVSLTNVAWPLNQSLLCAGSLGVSNQALGGSVSVRVHRGLVVLGYEDPLGFPA